MGAVKNQVIVHVVPHFDPGEQIGHTICSLINNTPGVHHIVAGSGTVGVQRVASAATVGGMLAKGAVTVRQVRPIVDEIGATAIHVHGDAAAMLGHRRLTEGRLGAATIYSWPKVPTDWRGLSARDMFGSSLTASAVVKAAVSARTVARMVENSVVFTCDRTVADRLHANGHTARFYTAAIQPHAEASVGSCRNEVVFSGPADLSTGVDVLIEAMGMLAERDVDVTARLVLQPGRHLARICNLAHRNPTISIQHGSATPELFNGALAAVVPHRLEQSDGRMLAELALSTATPLIFTPTETVRNVADDMCSMAVGFNDPLALAHAIEAFATSSGLRLAYGANAITRSRLRWDRRNLIDVTRAGYETWT